MFKSKDLYDKNVYDCNGKVLGRVKDIVIDFIGKRISGLVIKNSKFNEKIKYVNIDEVGEVIRCNNDAKIKGILFSEISNMAIIDTDGNEKGMIEELIIEEESFEIKGLVLGQGKIENLIKGKEIILMRNVVMQEGYILYFGESNITLKNISHDINKYKHRVRA